MNDCSVRKDRQPICINGRADFRDLDDRHISIVNKQHEGLARPPGFLVVLEKPRTQAYLNQTLPEEVSPRPSPLMIFPLDNDLLVLNKCIRRTILL